MAQVVMAASIYMDHIEIQPEGTKNTETQWDWVGHGGVNDVLKLAFFQFCMAEKKNTITLK